MRGGSILFRRCNRSPPLRRGSQLPLRCWPGCRSLSLSASELRSNSHLSLRRWRIYLRPPVRRCCGISPLRRRRSAQFPVRGRLICRRLFLSTSELRSNSSFPVLGGSPSLPSLDRGLPPTFFTLLGLTWLRPSRGPPIPVLVPVPLPLPSLPVSSKLRIRNPMVSRRQMAIVRRKLDQRPGHPGRFNIHPRSVIRIGPIPATFIGTVPVSVKKQNAHINIRDQVNISPGDYDHGRRIMKDHGWKPDVNLDPCSKRRVLYSPDDHKHP